MLKPTLIILFALILLSGCSNQKNKNDWEKDNLKGKVKSLKVFDFKAVDRFGKIEKDSLKSKSIYTYDVKGNRIETNIYNSDGSLSDNFSYKYDDKENKIESNRYTSDGRLYLKMLDQYDNKGNKIESNWYNSDSSLYLKTLYQYDNKGNKIKSNSYNPDGSFNDNFSYRYDNKGNMIESKSYKSDGSLEWKETNLYNNKGNIIKENLSFESYNKEMKNFDANSEYKYDDKGNWIEQIIHHSPEISYEIRERTFEYYE
jgi:uncharacterized lipoprotein NlpE involved in copper resistance